MRHLTIAALAAAAAAPLFAQSNAVPGMDAQIYNVVDVGYFGRRGAAYPNGEAGFGVGHSYCNSGSVDITWVANSGGVMVDTYPKIAFMLARERDGRMVQVSGRSNAKHSRAVFNFSSGPCAPCNTSARSTISIARSTPAQKPRGLASSTCMRRIIPLSRRHRASNSLFY